MVEPMEPTSLLHFPFSSVSVFMPFGSGTKACAAVQKMKNGNSVEIVYFEKYIRIRWLLCIKKSPDSFECRMCVQGMLDVCIDFWGLHLFERVDWTGIRGSRA
ncbi:hypothetical protein TNCV_2852761 [Trichonephila clavipes]|uniref:Uncharacterized protein n=1 Tax=Trichonephila clavipes TaxID=2585209 RepID=A0A8X6R5V9_TRICX|nr:hypothetical protein TNCV_2852761 [Trichonephila clavipes]